MVGLDDALSLSLDGTAACASRKSGTAACWEVTGEKPAMKFSDPFGFSDVKGALASGGVRCVLRTDGSVWCIGSFNTVHKIEKPERMTL